MSINNDFNALWRASANEAVSYSEDFPEALLVLPELIDGALGDGKATKINISITLNDNSPSILIVEDNGVGITSINRLTTWASKKPSSVEHVYGHGSKKCLTKWMPIYDNAVWNVKWRKQDAKGLSGCLNILSSPFLGLDTNLTDDMDEEITCINSGTKWTIQFNKEILKDASPSRLLEQIREIICTRYEKIIFINIKIIYNNEIIEENSTKWVTLKEALEEYTRCELVNITTKFIEIFEGIKIDCTIYKIICDGRGFCINNFPLYGVKNIRASRIHIGLNGRYIEPMFYNKFFGREIHNSTNGYIGFINFTKNTVDAILPTPCTTKVKFQEECPIFKKCIERIKARVMEEEKLQAKIKKEENDKIKEELKKIKAEEDEHNKLAKKIIANYIKKYNNDKFLSILNKTIT